MCFLFNIVENVTNQCTEAVIRGLEIATKDNKLDLKSPLDIDDVCINNDRKVFKPLSPGNIRQLFRKSVGRKLLLRIACIRFTTVFAYILSLYNLKNLTK